MSKLSTGLSKPLLLFEDKRIIHNGIKIKNSVCSETVETAVVNEKGQTTPIVSIIPNFTNAFYR